MDSSAFLESFNRINNLVKNMPEGEKGYLWLDGKKNQVECLKRDDHILSFWVLVRGEEVPTEMMTFLRKIMRVVVFRLGYSYALFYLPFKKTSGWGEEWIISFDVVIDGEKAKLPLFDK